MASVRLLVGTRKGAFILHADATRKKWNIQGPLFGGWDNITESVTDGPELVVNATVVLGSLDVRYPTP